MELVLTSVPHKAKDVLSELVPLRIPSINTLEPVQLQRSLDGAGKSALRSVKSFDVHDVGNVCANDVETNKSDGRKTITINLIIRQLK